MSLANSPTHLNSTLNRPMASQGGTRYEDRTMGRGQAGNNSAHHGNNVQANYSVSINLYPTTLYRKLFRLKTCQWKTFLSTPQEAREAGCTPLDNTW